MKRIMRKWKRLDRANDVNAANKGSPARRRNLPAVPMTRSRINLAVVAVLIATTAALASADQDRALSALEERQIMPLSEILVRAGLSGDRLLHADLEREDGRYVYELRVIAADGTIRLRHLDARSGEILPDGKLSDHPVGHEQGEGD
jgi:Peptidase propeptide and YPEB domain